MTHVFILCIKAYQLTLGQLLPRVCRFEPTCSQYAIEAIKEHGVMKGGVLSLWRIVRCNPFVPGGFDPVPAKRNKEATT
jgi:hypothetical protein